MMPGAVLRACCLFAFWAALNGVDLLGLVVGALAALLATLASLGLLPAGRRAIRPIALVGLVGSFLVGSIWAGLDVAWRALHPRMPLRPGLVPYKCSIAPGTTRSAFRTLTALLPGTLPVGSDGEGNLLVHCLDVGQPVARQLAAEEGRLLLALGGLQSDD